MEAPVNITASVLEIREILKIYHPWLELFMSYAPVKREKIERNITKNELISKYLIVLFSLIVVDNLIFIIFHLYSYFKKSSNWLNIFIKVLIDSLI